MQESTFFQRWTQGFVGDPTRFALRERIFHAFTGALCLAWGTAIPVTFFTAPHWIAISAATLGAFAMGTFYYFSRFRDLFPRMRAPVMIVTMVLADLEWFFTAGNSGALMAAYGTILVYFLAMADRSHRRLILVLFLVHSAGLVFIQETFPQWIVPYPDEAARQNSFVSCMIITAALLTFLIVALKGSYENEQTRLNAALKELRRLKEQQDGDYFLTALLIEPLTKISYESPSLAIDWFVKQKKQFRFRHRDLEIGGDICLVERLHLRGRSYCLIANGDAMGKSIQGAGGVLVFGSVFRSILERTRKTAAVREYFPERWLVSALADLEAVFHSFDGSMGMSLFLGLIDEATGSLFYINAEHPLPVLYRDGRAAFLDLAAGNRKLGFGCGRGIVRYFHLRENDVLLVGSDGKDDLAVGKNGDRRIMNDRADAFLGLVESSGAMLEPLARELEEAGEQTDDLSILRLFFGGSAAESPSPESETFQHFFREARYMEAAEIGIQLVDANPGDVPAIRDTTIALERCGRFEEAIDYAERIRARFPADRDILFHLGRLYELIQRADAANLVLAEWSAL